MALRTPAQYVESLRDGRTVYYRVEHVPDVTVHPELGSAIRHAALEYASAQDPAHSRRRAARGFTTRYRPNTRWSRR